MVKREEFFTIWKGPFPMRDFLGAMESPWCSVWTYGYTQREYINDIVTQAHISGSNSTLFSSLFKSKIGWVHWWGERRFSQVEKVQFPWGVFLEPWGLLEVVINHMVAPKEILLNDLINHAYISGSKPTSVSFNFKILTSYLNWSSHLPRGCFQWGGHEFQSNQFP